MIVPSKERSESVIKARPQRGILTMSEIGYVQKLTLPGILSALLVLGCGSGTDAAAAGLRQSVSPFILMKAAQAQAVGEDEQAAARRALTVGDAELEDDVPFSELNEALTAARSRLTELTKAAEIAKVASELRERLQATEAENQQLRSVLEQLQIDNSDLLSARQTADRQIQELTESAGGAASEAKRLDEELATVRAQNVQLATRLSQAEAGARGAVGELAKVRDELGARAETLEAVADQSASEITRLQRELDTAREQVLIAERQQAERIEELEKLRLASDDSATDNARLAQDLDGTITELATTRTELSAKDEALEQVRIALEATEGEKDVLREQLAGTRSESDELRAQLESAAIDLENYRTVNANLEQQVDLLKTAAGEATDAARQNLLAVESQINEINAALASVKADELLPGAGGPVIEDDGEGTALAAAPPGSPTPSASGDGWVPRPSPPRDGASRQLITATASSTIEAADARNPFAAGTDGRPRAVQTDAGPSTINLASLTNDLPANRRRDAEALLGKLRAAKDDRGLSMTVPGELLFAVNSEEIEPDAFEALASVAQLVDLYDRRDIVIVGHTDAVGDAGYNQQLSERRAILVKQYFVDNFGISAERLQVEGKGEQDPISSNATADGRNANRRVEVVILD